MVKFELRLLRVGDPLVVSPLDRRDALDAILGEQGFEGIDVQQRIERSL